MKGYKQELGLVFAIPKRLAQIFSICLEHFKTANTASLKAGCHVINVCALEETVFRLEL